MRSPIFSYPLSGIGTAQWDQQGSLVLPLDYIQLAFGVTVGGILSQNAAGITYSFLFTLDDMGPDNKFACSVMQAGTSVTVVDANLGVTGGVASGDISHIFGTGSALDGWYVIGGVTPTNYTFNAGVSRVIPTRGGYHGYYRLFAAPPALTGQTTRTSGCLAHSTTGPSTGLVLRTTSGTAGTVTGVVVQGAGPG